MHEPRRGGLGPESIGQHEVCDRRVVVDVRHVRDAGAERLALVFILSFRDMPEPLCRRPSGCGESVEPREQAVGTPADSTEIGDPVPRAGLGFDALPAEGDDALKQNMYQCQMVRGLGGRARSMFSAVSMIRIEWSYVDPCAIGVMVLLPRCRPHGAFRHGREASAQGCRFGWPSMIRSIVVA